MMIGHIEEFEHNLNKILTCHARLNEFLAVGDVTTGRYQMKKYVKITFVNQMTIAGSLFVG